MWHSLLHVRSARRWQWTMLRFQCGLPSNSSVYTLTDGWPWVHISKQNDST
jgi:hypothetical protein